MYVSIGKDADNVLSYASCCEVSNFGRGECEYREYQGGGLVVWYGMTASWKRVARILIQAFGLGAVKRKR